ncbi:Alkanesulfonate monooxygenase [Aquisphaera giovannonii]|uniref:Alkanesulfonate monooxygenase n=1 Tax=Aquisphaera giovannonii TaxID=406548 RepID=A0A5B9WF21_9BACT|nr:LLM class flavin-dependent oxidoreductase [Aquisphaera giovannonii]QEH38551.1 Alkanesulfonate monooxygenase [Aquisphaera giovannonii]
MALRFHWRMLQGGEGAGLPRGTQNRTPSIGMPELDGQAEFCRRAVACGMDSLLLDFGYAKPDPILLAAALGMKAGGIGFIVAYRSGLMSPVTFVQQLNTLSALIGGRFSLNIVAGHSPDEQRSYGDHLDHDRRYARTDEFLAVCHAFWEGRRDIDFAGEYYRIEKGNLNSAFQSERRTSPEIYIAGSSEAARRLAVARGTCWMQIGDTVERIARAAEAVRGEGIDVGLRLSVIARPTREEAVAAARALVDGLGPGGAEKDVEGAFIRRSDSQSMRDMYRRAGEEWLSPTLWAGAVRSHGPASIALVGSPRDIAGAILEYERAGVTQFILSGWPKVESMEYFGREILPIIRHAERAAGGQAPREPGCEGVPAPHAGRRPADVAGERINL